MDRRDYNRLTSEQFNGRKARTLRQISSGVLSLPAGSIVTIKRKFSGFEIATTPCQCCGKMAFSATIKIVCAKCLVPFEFLGLQAGDSPGEPLVSVDRLELRAPITPQGQEPNLNLPGYRINIGGPGAGPVS